MRTPSAYFPVVIVGAGPTGLTLANLLARHGVHFLLVERNATTVQEPRAVSIDDEALRTMQAAGVIDAVLADVVPGYGSTYYTARKSRFAKVEPKGAPYGYPRRNAFRQPHLEGQLRRALEREPRAELLFGWKLEGFSQGLEGVELNLVAHHGQSRHVSCDYMVGCDGAGSTVRGSLGIVLEGTTYAERWLIVDLENHDNPTKHTEVYCDPRLPCITLPGPHRTRRYEFEIRSEESDAAIMAPDRIGSLLKKYGADPNAVLSRTAVYRYHARVARPWSVDRVFLAGDAAHLSPPFAGQGMNSGVRDAHNLAWKLAAVLSGTAGRGLLQSYEQERADHAWQMIRLALRMGRVMAPTTRLSALLTQTGLFLACGLPPLRHYIAEMKYKPQARFVRGFILPGRWNSRDTLVGRLLPQPSVVTADGARRLLDDVIGPRFALLIRTTDPRGAFSRLDHPVWGDLRAAFVAVVPSGCDPWPTVPGVDVVMECDLAFAALLGDEHEDVMLVRPDRYVAACFPIREASIVAAGVAVSLARTWSGEVRQADIAPRPRSTPQQGPATATESNSPPGN